MRETPWVQWLPSGTRRLGRNFLNRYSSFRSLFNGGFKAFWTRFWMRYAGLDPMGRLATCLATWFTPPYKACSYLAAMNLRGYIAPSAAVYHRDLRLGANVFIGDRVTIYQADENGGPVELGDRVHLHQDTIIEVGSGGSVMIGADTHVQPRCQFSGYKTSIRIGRGVQIAPNCGFYPYDHGFAPGELIGKQPIQTKGGIIIGDDAWLGFGVIVLDGVRIGKGAVVGAGAVVTRDVPDETIAVGVPARVVKRRCDLNPGEVTQPLKAVERGNTKR
jgi:acetyltransferase-like isoleucine patch superfamily enzyme